MRGRRRRSVVVAVVALAVAASCTSLPAPIESEQPLPADRHVEVAAERWVTDRLVELELRSPSVGTTAARILLPRRFRQEPDRTWPVLYLLHGGGGTFRDWSEAADLEAIVGDRDLLVVMPDGGIGATYLNWVFAGPTGRPQWETFHLVELRNLLAARYRSNDRLAVAGLSAGGFGAMSYAARHPDLFRAVASFSGNLDTRDDDLVGPLLSAIVTYALERNTPLGDPYVHEARWRGHNPLDLAPNLAHTAVFVSAGDGQYGALDPPLTLPDWLTLESSTHRRTVRFVQRMQALGLDLTADLYGHGTHSFRYWARELERAMPLLAGALEGERPPPLSFTFRSVDDHFDVWGWRFDVTGRAGPAFTDVAVDGDRVAATGNGVLTITPPPHLGGAPVTVELGDTAEQYTTGVDQPGPRPTGPPVIVRVGGSAPAGT